MGLFIRNSVLFFIISVLSSVKCQRTYTKEYVRQLREEVREMFQHAYNGYLEYASDYDELRPLSCDGVNTWGSYSLTLIDALDTLAVMGNYTEFRRVVNLLSEKINFDKDINVSVFETNIRIVGGLLSAHLMSHKAGAVLEPGWPCNGPLLRMAEDVARRLLPAFDTKTGMPYGTVNLKHGVPPGETSVTCTAGVGTFIVEFGALSRLTGDPIYEETALNALYSLWDHKSSIGLFGNHIDVQTGRWTAQDSGIGAGIDSYYEYLVKGAILLDRPELLEMFHEGRRAIEKYMKRDDWYVWVSMNKGQVTLPVFQSLEAYWPGVLSLIGETRAAMKTLRNYHSVWRQYGFLPEFYNIPTSEASANRESYPLRPELIESIMHLYRATKDQFLLEMGEDILKSIQYSARTKCGYATIKNVRDHRKEDRMESFFLAETTKYLYLLFDPDNFLNNDGGSGEVIDMPHGKCVIDAGGYVFNTEAHPIDSAALKCCYEMPRQITLDLDFEKYRGDLLVFNDKEDVEYSCAKKQVPNAPESIMLDIGSQLDVKEPEKKVEDSQSSKSDEDDLLDALDSEFSQEESDLLGIAIIDELLHKGFVMAIAPEKERFKTIVTIMEKNMVMTYDTMKKVLKRIDDGTYDSADIQLIKTNHKDRNETFEIIMDYYVQHARMILHMNIINGVYHKKRSKGQTYAKDIDTLHLTLEALRLSNEILLTPENFEIYALLLKAQRDYETYLTIKTLDAAFFSEMYEDAYKAFSEVGRNATANFNKKYDDYVKTKKTRLKELVVDRPTYSVYAKLEELIAEVKRNFTSENRDDEPTIIDLNEPDKIPPAKPLTLKPLHKSEGSTESPPTKENDDIILAVDDENVDGEHGTNEDSGDNNANDIIDDDDDEITGEGTVEPVVFDSETDVESDMNEGTVEPVSASPKSETKTDTVDDDDNEETSDSDQSSESKSENLNGNTSILPDFVQTILKSTLPSRPKFDPQLFLEKIRAKGLYLNKKKNFNLFYCRAQPFVERLTGGAILT